MMNQSLTKMEGNSRHFQVQIPQGNHKAYLLPPPRFNGQRSHFIYLFCRFLARWQAQPDHTGLKLPSVFLCLHSTSISSALITFLPHPLILWRKKPHQNNYFMSPNMQIIFFNERCLTSPIQLICKCRRGFICDILSG